MVMLALVTFAKVGRHDTVPENRIPWRRAWLSAPLSDAPPGGAPPGGRLAYWSPSIDRRGDATTSRRRRDHSHPARQYIRKAWWTWRERRRAIPPATGWTVSPERVIQASDCATSLDFRLFASIAARSAVQPAPSRLRRLLRGWRVSMATASAKRPVGGIFVAAQVAAPRRLSRQPQQPAVTSRRHDYLSRPPAHAAQQPLQQRPGRNLGIGQRQQVHLAARQVGHPIAQHDSRRAHRGRQFGTQPVAQQ